MKTYARYNGDVLVQTAKIKRLVSGRYAVATSLFGEKPFECNMNIPLFQSGQDAEKCLFNSGWKIIAEWRPEQDR